MERINFTIKSSSHVLAWLYCHDLVMILTSVPCIMICHDLDKGTMVNHDLARLNMIMARVPWLRTLGRHKTWRNLIPRKAWFNAIYKEVTTTLPLLFTEKIYQNTTSLNCLKQLLIKLNLIHLRS